MQNGERQRREGRLFARYLLKEEPPEELVERYVAADTALFGTKNHDVLTSFVERHPWSLPYLDAAAAFLQPTSLLRKKLLVTLAIVETTPHYTHLFLPSKSSLLHALWRLSCQGVLSAFSLLLGMLLYPLAMRAR